MAQLTLLDMTQNILSAMGSDAVDTINATTESTQVHSIIKDVYYKIINERDWPFLQKIDQLTGLGDIAEPTKVQIPTEVSRINWIKYDVRLAVGDARQMRDIVYLTPFDFMTLVSARDQNAANVTEYTVPGANVVLPIITDQAPSYWTSFDDQYIYFDSIDTGIDTTIQESKTVVHATFEPTWSAGDTFIPSLPDHMFPLLLSQSKVECTSKIKQSADQIEERDAKRQRVTLQHRAHRQNGFIQGPDFGRGRGGASISRKIKFGSND